VTRKANTWTYANGTGLPTELIDTSTGLPPLLPKAQHSTKDAPVAGDIQQIKNVVSTVRSCQGPIGLLQIESSHFDMDDYGVVMAWMSTRLGANVASGAAIANLDLSKARTSTEGQCVRLILPCKTGECARIGNSATRDWQIIVKSSDDTNTVLNALRSIARYYPDGSGEIK
jgi:hypothetical protein